MQEPNEYDDHRYYVMSQDNWDFDEDEYNDLDDDGEECTCTYPGPTYDVGSECFICRFCHREIVDDEAYF